MNAYLLLQGMAVCAPPYQYIGHVYNTSSWLSFKLLVTGRRGEKLYIIKRDKSRGCCIANDFKVQQILVIIIIIIII